jgi:RimJ/RimL family protein N-acetyltransferase
MGTDRACLRAATIDELVELGGKAAWVGVAKPGIQPFIQPWHQGQPIDVARRVVTWQLGVWAAMRPDAWTLPFVAFVNGEPVGVQELSGVAFGQLGEVTSSSWLVRSHHGKGLAVHLRAMVLELAFSLGAVRARSGFLDGNEASAAVSERCGYVFDGTRNLVVDRHARVEQRLVLEARRWRQVRAELPSVVVDGLDDMVKEQLGAAVTGR